MVNPTIGLSHLTMASQLLRSLNAGADIRHKGHI